MYTGVWLPREGFGRWFSIHRAVCIAKGCSDGYVHTRKSHLLACGGAERRLLLRERSERRLLDEALLQLLRDALGEGELVPVELAAVAAGEGEQQLAKLDRGAQRVHVGVGLLQQLAQLLGRQDGPLGEDLLEQLHLGLAPGGGLTPALAAAAAAAAAPLLAQLRLRLEHDLDSTRLEWVAATDGKAGAAGADADAEAYAARLLNECHSLPLTVAFVVQRALPCET